MEGSSINADTIFAAFSTVEAVWTEIDRLSNAVPEAFAPDLAVKYQEQESGYTAGRTHFGYHYLVTGAVPRQRTSGQLLLAFDFTRQASRSTWPSAQTALLTCAYAPSYDNGWALSHVLVGSDGRLASADAAAACVAHFDDRLLSWGAPTGNWGRSSWLFSVPLLAIDGPAALRREIVVPVLGLLRAIDISTNPFNGIAAVSYAMPAAA